MENKICFKALEGWGTDLNNKLGLFFRTISNLGEKDVFKNTQGRLTRLYSGILMLFLILFMVIVYSVLYVVILNNQERELRSLADQEATFMESYLLKNARSSLQEVQDQEVVFAGANQFFTILSIRRDKLFWATKRIPGYIKNYLAW